MRVELIRVKLFQWIRFICVRRGLQLAALRALTGLEQLNVGVDTFEFLVALSLFMFHKLQVHFVA